MADNKTLYFADDAVALPPTEEGAIDGRYLKIGDLGQGGMGAVWLVQDLRLDVPLAMKVIHAPMAIHTGLVGRFRMEARLTARLQHPGVVPVYDLGILPDGRVYYTMMRVEGKRFSDVLAAEPLSGELSSDRPRVFRLVSILAQVADTVAFAHSQGVLHRDLKPDNIMVGAHGQVLVLDWGIARVLSPEEPSAAPPLGSGPGDHASTTPSSPRSSPSPLSASSLSPSPFSASRLDTAPGSVAGTPAYMAPEQARGEVWRLGPPTDVFALGGILWEILTGEPPGASIPEGSGGLKGVAAAALAPAPEDRLPHAGAFADALRRWLDGSLRRDKALAWVEAADFLEEERPGVAIAASPPTTVTPLQLRTQLDVLEAAWAAEDAVQEAAILADRREANRLALLERALQEAPELDEPRIRLAAALYRRHQEAEERGDPLATELEARLRLYDRGELAEYLRGVGTLSLDAERPAQVVIAPLLDQHRRRLPGAFRSLGNTPLHAVELPIGDYLARLVPEAGPPVSYPFRITRGAAWTEPELPLPRDLPEADVYVPRGPFLSGGDVDAAWQAPRSWAFVGGFAMRRHPVTCREYLAFLNDRSTAGVAIGPLLPASAAWTVGAEGQVSLEADGDLDRWNPSWPVCLVTALAAEAFVAWEAARTGLPWRLPTENEWEKAARGTDGRRWPWGDGVVAGFSAVRGTVRTPAPVEEFPLDASVYGVRGLGGNVRCWCADPFSLPELAGSDREEPHRAARGGSWTNSLGGARSARRNGHRPVAVMPDLGIRLARSWPLP